jgi:glycosyltransferase involved in cell wall biosynthesis
LRIISFSAFAPVLSYRFRRKSIVTIYHILGNDAITKTGFIIGSLAKFSEKLALHSAANKIAISESVKSNILQCCKRDNIRVIYTGFDETLLSSQDEKPKDNGSILFLGRMDFYMKGLDLLIESFGEIIGKIPDAKLILAGRADPIQSNKLETFIQKYVFRDNIIMEFNISAARKKELLQNCRLVCLPSRYEGWCISAIEAGACKKPVVGTNIPGLRDSVIHGQTGVLVAPNDKNELSGAIFQTYSDEALRIRLGFNAWKRSQSFRWNRIAQEQMEYYLSVLDAQGKFYAK